MAADQTDEQLMRRFQRGEARAFETLMLRHRTPIYSFLLRFTGERTRAEDLVQETFLKAIRAQRQYQPGTNMKAWLFTILHNTFLNTRRQAGRAPTTVDSEMVERAAADVAASVETPEQLLMRASLDADLQEALDLMPDAFRQAVWLRDVEEFSYAEIAKMLKVPIGTVMSRISRGRRLLHAHLTSKGDRSVGAALPEGSRA